MATEESTSSPTTKKSPSKKQPAARKEGSGQRSAPRAAAPKRISGPEVASAAARQLLELTGKGAEGVTSLQRTEDGWKVHVEVVEVRRIPDTTDILALYEVEMDDTGDLQGYRRLRRYARGVPGED
jgi:hypothetical protein